MSKKMPLPMSDLVAKAQGDKHNIAITSNRYHKYRYHNGFKTIGQLGKIAGIHPSTLHSRFRRGDSPRLR